jgi:hypothetical protein
MAAVRTLQPALLAGHLGRDLDGVQAGDCGGLNGPLAGVRRAPRWWMGGGAAGRFLSQAGRWILIELIVFDAGVVFRSVVYISPSCPRCGAAASLY